MEQRISRKQLMSLKTYLSEKDLAIISEIRRYHFLTTNQIKRLYYYTGSTSTANLRAASKCLKRLREKGLIAPLERRIGGVQAGSSSLVWHLTEPGERLLWLDAHDQKHPRKRFEEPSQTFLTHTLAVAEFAVQLIVAGRDENGHEIKQLDPEPYCWRFYTYNGEKAVLKPDLYTVLRDGRHSLFCYIEIDLGTESRAQLVRKCQMYYDHYLSGDDLDRIGISPLVVWIMPNEERKLALEKRIAELYPEGPMLFHVYSATDNVPWRLTHDRK